MNRAFKKSRSEDGFTLLELLVVIVLIGILAAIAVPVFINAQNAAHDASVKSDARNTVIGVASGLVTKPDATGFSVLAAGDTVAVATAKLAGVPSVIVTIPNGAIAVRAVVTQSNWVTVRGNSADWVVHAQSTIDGFWYEFSSKTGKYTSSTDNPPVTPKVPSSKDPVTNSVKNPDGTPVRVPGDPVTTTTDPGTGTGGTGGTGGGTGAVGSLATSESGMYYLNPAGSMYSFNALTADGTNSFPTSLSPILPDTKFSKVSGGSGYHTLALDNHGKLWTWGKTARGALGTGPISPDRPADPATMITPDATYTDIAAGYQASYAIDMNGHLWSWGLDSRGQLGGGTFKTAGTQYNIILWRDTPEMVTPDVTYKSVSAGHSSALAIDTNGHLWTFGDNGYGRGNNAYCLWHYGQSFPDGCYDETTNNNITPTVADGTPTTPPTPLMLTPDRTYRSAEQARDHSNVIDSSGHLWAWGRGAHGQIGDGLASDTYAPVAITPSRTYKSVSGEKDGYAGMSMALDTSDHLWSWGGNTEGELGDGTSTERDTPVAITPTITYAQVAAGENGESYALGTDGVIWGWGQQYFSNTNDYQVPQVIAH